MLILKRNSSSDLNQELWSSNSTCCATVTEDYNINNNNFNAGASQMPQIFRTKNVHLMDLMDFRHVTICHVDNEGMLQKLKTVINFSVRNMAKA